jgi:putative Mg2+ transporter-C (MgtC) family protein
MAEIESILRTLLEVDPTPLILAVALSGLIGFEREMHGRPAGLRTHILVCLASTVLMLVTRNLPRELSTQLVDATVVLDPTRLAAGIVTGIGFLGAACVIRSGDIVRGITTGACIWSVSALGIVIGFEAYGLAIAATIGILVVLVLLDRLEGWISPIIYRRLVIRCESRELSALADTVRGLLRKKRIRVQDLTGFMGTQDGPSQLVFRIRCRNNFQAPEMLEQVCCEKGVLRADWD